MGKGWEVIASTLNIRSGPGTQFGVIGSEIRGSVLISPEGWTPILLEDGSIGWCSSAYLQAVEIEDEVVAGQPTGAAVVAKAMTQTGDPYIYAYEVNLADPDPKAFDCSELVQWVCAQLKIAPTMPDGAIYQMQHCQKYGTLIPISTGVKKTGALLFRIASSGNHVVISRGDGSTIEAKGSAYGVGVFSSEGRGWTHAALIPGVAYV